MILLILYCLFISYLTQFTYCDIVINEPIDLTWGFDNTTLYWPDQIPFTFIKKSEGLINGSYWYSANSFCAGEHGGTHFDSPYHFNEHGWKVGDVPVSRLIGTGAIVDVSNEVGNNQNFILEDKHLINWEKENGPFSVKSILLVRTGWSKRYHSRNNYFGETPDGKLHFPGIGQSAAEWIVKSKKFMGVGIDTASVDTGNEVITHQILMADNIYHLENVKMLQTLPARNFTLIVMPMKITEGSGGPCRVVAIP